MVFSNILYTRLLPNVESKLGHYQAGFHPRKSTINHIFGLRQILKKMKEFRISIHLLFVDFKSAFDSTDRKQMYVAMNELNISQKLIRLVRMIISNMHSQIKIQSKLSAPFIIPKGVQQGDALACLLFNTTLEYAIRKSGIQTRGTIFYKSFQLMAYADDTVIIGRYLASIKDFQLLEEASKKVGLVINEGKTKYMVAANTQNCSKSCATEIGGYSFERVDSYMYLGSLVNGDNNVSEEITNHLIATNRSYFGIKSQFQSQLLSRKTKILLYKT